MNEGVSMATPSIIHFYKNVKGVAIEPLAIEGVASKGGNYNLMEFRYLLKQKRRQKAIGKTHVDDYS
jgi:hypothetical protein